MVVLYVNKVSFRYHCVHAMPVEHSVNVYKLVIWGISFDAALSKVACCC